MDSNDKSLAIGIDLGNANSAISTVNKYGKAEPIPTESGKYTKASVVYMENGIDPIVGNMALSSRVADPTNYIEGIKAFLSNDVMGKDNQVLYKDATGKEYNIEDLTAIVICSLVEDVKRHTGQDSFKSVISCPANWNNHQRSRLKHICEDLVGIPVLRVVTEPACAASGYGYDKQKDMTLLTIDSGHGTTDVTICRIENGTVNILATNGANSPAGGNIDRILMEDIKEKIKNQFGKEVDWQKNPESYYDALERVVELKHTLSVRKKKLIVVGTPYGQFKHEYTIQEFDSLIKSEGEALEQLIVKTVNDASIDMQDIDCVILVGGTSRVRMFGNITAKITGQEAKKNIDTDKVVSQGSALLAYRTASGAGDTVLSSDGKYLPSIKDNFADVCSFGLGASIYHLQVNKMYCAQIIPKDTPIPVKMEDIFSVISGDQVSVKVFVLQGEDGVESDQCHPIREVHLEGIPMRSPSKPTIKVIYEYEKIGLLNVTVLDMISGKSKSIKITKGI